ncbi:hypothetical protein ACFL6I_10680 [candidate division KSB1 bacterium]
MSEQKPKSQRYVRKEQKGNTLLERILYALLAVLTVVVLIIVAGLYMKYHPNAQSSSVSMDSQSPLQSRSGEVKAKPQPAKKAWSFDFNRKDETPSFKKKITEEDRVRVAIKKWRPSIRGVTLTNKSDPSPWYFSSCFFGDYHSVDIVSKDGRRQSGSVCVKKSLSFYRVSSSSFK